MARTNVLSGLEMGNGLSSLSLRLEDGERILVERERRVAPEGERTVVMMMTVVFHTDMKHLKTPHALSIAFALSRITHTHNHLLLFVDSNITLKRSSAQHPVFFEPPRCGVDAFP